MDLEKKQETVVTKGKEWAVGFGQSDFYKNLSPDLKMNALGIIENYILLMFNNYDRLPGKWTQKDTVNVVSKDFPSKVADYEDYYEDVVPVLTTFFNYLTAENLIKNGDTLLRGLEKADEELAKERKDFTANTLKEEKKASPNKKAEKVSPKVAEKSEKKVSEISTEKVEKKDTNTTNSWEKPARPQQKVVNGKRQPIHVTKIGRNDPCPCGSGKKYKKCHGR